MVVGRSPADPLAEDAGRDPGGKEPECLYYYTWDASGQKFARHEISPPGAGVGTGMQICVADLAGDGMHGPDVQRNGVAQFY